MTTKVVALADALGNLVRFVLLPGQRHDSLGVERLITDIEFAALIADEAFDNNAIRAELNERGALAVIPSKGDRKTLIPHDAEMYKWRHLIENCFQWLKEFRHIATRLRQDRHQLLAIECFNKAAIEEHPDGAEVFRRMGRRYISETQLYDATLRHKSARRLALPQLWRRIGASSRAHGRSIVVSRRQAQ